MTNTTSRNNRHSRSRNPLRSSARYNEVNENTDLAKAMEESKKTAAYEKKHANLEELALYKASEESKKLKNLKNSEELAANLQEIENQEAINRLRKIHEQENSNLKMAKSLQKGTKKSFNKNGSFARKLQANYNMEYAKSIYNKHKPKSNLVASIPKLQANSGMEYAKSVYNKHKPKSNPKLVASIPKSWSILSSEESKESEPPPPRYVLNPSTVRLRRTRSKTVSRPVSKSKRWWPF